MPQRAAQACRGRQFVSPGRASRRRQIGTGESWPWRRLLVAGGRRALGGAHGGLGGKGVGWLWPDGSSACTGVCRWLTTASGRDGLACLPPAYHGIRTMLLESVSLVASRFPPARSCARRLMQERPPAARSAAAALVLPRTGRDSAQARRHAGTATPPAISSSFGFDAVCAPSLGRCSRPLA